MLFRSDGSYEYTNLKTNERQWDHPSDDKFKQKVIDERRKKQQSKAPQSSILAQIPQMQAPALPPQSGQSGQQSTLLNQISIIQSQGKGVLDDSVIRRDVRAPEPESRAQSGIDIPGNSTGPKGSFTEEHLGFPGAASIAMSVGEQPPQAVAQGATPSAQAEQTGHAQTLRELSQQHRAEILLLNQ